MLISIVIPVYNVEQYIEHCLCSVMNQSYQGEIECILVDDCGNDNSIDIAESIIKNYSGNYSFRIVHHDRNRGISASRNTGIKEAKGDYIYFIDSDDWIALDCISTIVDQLKKYPQSEIVISSAESENEWVIRESLVGREDIPEYTEDTLWIMNGLLSRPVLFHLSPWNKLISKKFILDNNLFFLEGFIREDEIWSFHYSKYVKRVAFCKRNTYHYRISPNGIVHSSEDYSSSQLRLRIVNHYLDNITELGKDIQLKLISTMLIDTYIKTHNDSRMLSQCRSLFRRLYVESSFVRKLGCLVFIGLSHKLVCKRPIFFLTKRFLFDC